MTQKKIDGRISLERATSYIILSSQKQVERIVPLLDGKMFLEKSTWTLLTTALDLAKRDIFSRNTVCSAAESAGVDRAGEHYNLLAASYTSSATFENHYPLWLDQGRLCFIERSQDPSVEAEFSSDELITHRRMVLDRARLLGEVDQGSSMDECTRSALSSMEDLRNSNGTGIIQTGFGILDKYMLGLMPKTLTVVGARPSRGKTSLACQLALRAQSPTSPVLFVSAEMPADKVAIKIASMHSRLNTRQFLSPHLLSDQEFNSAKTAVLSASGLNIRILHKTDVSAVEASVLSMDPAPSLVIFDFLQILPTPSRFDGMRADYLSEVVRSFARLADKTSCAFLLLSQIGRSGERGGASNADLKGSGGIEEAADAIILIEKDDEAEGGPDSLRRTLRLSKNRYGWGDDIECPVLFDPRTQNFSDWDLVKAQRIATALGI